MNGLRHVKWDELLGWRVVVALILGCWVAQAAAYWVATSLPYAEASADRITVGFDRHEQQRTHRERTEALALAENQPTE